MACTSGPYLHASKLSHTDTSGPAGSAVTALPCLTLLTIRKRADFLRAARAQRTSCPAFLVQARARGDDARVRVGFTCSKKVGNAVTRNRAKRRLREIARQVLREHGKPGFDYVLVGRPQVTVTHDFTAMCRDLEKAVKKLHKRVA